MGEPTEIIGAYEAQVRRELERHDRQIQRRIAIMSKLRTKKYVAQLRELMREAGVFAAEFVKDTGKGKKQKSEYPAIKWEWVHQYENGGYSGDSFAGYIYLQVKPNRFLRLQYSM